LVQGVGESRLASRKPLFLSVHVPKSKVTRQKKLLFYCSNR